jgi:hypothetical protein
MSQSRVLLHSFLVLVVAVATVLATTLAARSAQAQAPGGVRVDVQCQAQVDESYLLVTVEAKITGDGGQAVDLDARPLRLPLLAPVVGGAVLDHGVLPNGAQSVEVEGVAPLRVDKEGGGLLVRGKLKAGEVGTARARMAIGFADSHLELGMVGPGSQTWVSFVVAMSPPTRLKVTVSRPARVSQVEEGNERLTGASLTQGLQPGEMVVFSIDDLPASPAGPRRVLSGLALFAGVVGAWYLLRRVRLPAAVAEPRADAA